MVESQQGIQPKEPEVRPSQSAVKLLLGNHSGFNAYYTTRRLYDAAAQFYRPDAVNIYLFEESGDGRNTNLKVSDLINSHGALQGTALDHLAREGNNNPSLLEIDDCLQSLLQQRPWNFFQAQLMDKLRKDYSVQIATETVPDEAIDSLRKKYDEADTHNAQALQAVTQGGSLDKMVKPYRKGLRMYAELGAERDTYLSNRIQELIMNASVQGKPARILGLLGGAHGEVATILRDKVAEGEDSSIETEVIVYTPRQLKLQLKMKEGYIPSDDELLLSLFSNIAFGLLRRFSPEEGKSIDFDTVQRTIEERYASPKEVKKWLRAPSRVKDLANEIGAIARTSK